MKILFLGNFEAEFSSENYYKRTLKKMGHAVISMQEGNCDSVLLCEKLMSEKPDRFFWVHTHGWRTHGIEHFLDLCRNQKVPSFAYHLDLYMGIQREKDLERDPFFKVDHFFTVDALMSTWMNMEKQKAAGFAQGHFLPAGVFEDECFAGTADKEKYPHEIIFTGSKGYHPEWPYRPQLIDWLHKTYGDKFGHYGGGGRPTVRGPELNNLYASAKIVIGDTLCKNFDYPWYSSDRLFEACGRGAFMIYPYIKGLDNFYSHTHEIFFYKFDPEFRDLKFWIDTLLVEDDTTRKAVQWRAIQRSREEHTYRHRMQTIIDNT